jgi:hypothetical protein
MKNYTPEVARDLSSKLIQDLMDGIRFKPQRKPDKPLAR